ncbi:MAG: hypothetical protein ACQGVK_09125 [Myxococcota bacterium]
MRRPLASHPAAALLALGLLAAATAVAPAAGAEGLDLQDPTPRWVEVAFERSPPEEPGRLRGRFTTSFPAWLEPGPEAGQIQVTIGRGIVEAHLLDQYVPVPESFSDFVWVFDADSGHVVSARLQGAVVTPMELGFLRTRTVTRLVVDMTSRQRAGFQRPSRILGNDHFPYCSDPDSLRCRIVPGYALDRETGWVNAVGAISARTGPVKVISFSPLGEARFVESGPSPDVASGPPLAVSGEADLEVLEGP